MSGGGEGSGAIKRTSRLAVFEHIIEKEKPRKPKRCRPINRYYDSSPSESELIIDEFEDDVEPVKKKYKKIVKHSEEPLNLICDWDDCLQSFTDYEKFNKHINEHVSELRENDSCLWKDCTFDGSLTLSAKQHISHHGYLTKLKCIGNNVVERNNLPSCSVPDQYLFPSVLLPYLCEWEDCMLECETIYDFYMHIKCHIRNNPAQAKNGEIIQCFWRGCTSAKYSSQYKLAEHVRVHTKEKTIACPTCCTLFSNNTKFCDHRKRQLPTDLQSYQCSQCLKLFATERLLRDHMRSHINHYKCTMCDMTCPSPSILAKHMRHRHVKERFFTCNTCKKSFIEKHNLRTHLLTHMKENQMKCEICNYTCRTAYGLECHMVRDHDQPSSQVYECHCCKEVFTRGGYLTKHLMKVHNYHWPSGHSRFRYRQDQDGIFRLQTVRYESLEVTQEMIRSESLQTSQQISELSNHPSEVTIAYEGEELNKKVVVTSSNLPPQTENNSVLITVHDVDEEGNVLKSEVIEAKEIFYDNINLSVDGTQDENSVDIDDEELIKFHDPVPKAEK